VSYEEGRKKLFLVNMVNAKLHFGLNLRAICLLQRAKTANIQRLKNIRCVSRQTQSKDVILKAEVSEFRCPIAAIAIKDEQPPFAFAMLRVFIEMLNPFEA
jgi:hypothetical protein